MRICIPTATDEGKDAVVFPHFGSAPFFSVLETDSGEVQPVANGNRRHEHGQCNPVGALLGVGPDAVVVRGMGRNALARLTEAGIPVYVATGETVREVGTQIREGRIRPLDVEAACAGHADAGHAHPHHHHHG